MTVDDDVIQVRDLGKLDFIAEGGQGKVFRVPDLSLADCPGGLAYKQYKPGQVTAAGLEKIVSVRSAMNDAERRKLDSIAAWPSRMVKDGTQMTGILMPLIPSRFRHRGTSTFSGESFDKEREIQYLFIAPNRCQALGFPLVNLFQRYAICRELAGALAFLAARKVVFGDVNAKNALFDVGPGRHDGSIMLVDCDAVRISGSGSAVPQLNAPDWEPPKDERSSLTHETDVFKFALFVIRCLSPGQGASTARDPRRLDKLLDAEGQRLLRASLDTNKRARPRAAEWRDYFDNVLNGLPTAPIGSTAPSASPASRGSKVPVGVVASGLTSSETATAPPKVTGWVRDDDGNWVHAD